MNKAAEKEAMADDPQAMHVSSDDFQDVLDKAAEEGKPVFVDFYADWCGPCKMAAPIIDKLSEEYKDKAVVAKLNVDENNDLAAEHGVMSIPTVIVFTPEDGKMEESDRKIGFPGEQGYVDMLERALGDE